MSVQKDRRHVSDLAREFERLVAQGELWPGFDPLAIPLVFYDGDDTYLFRCPEVLEDFREMRVGECDVLVYDGRYPVVTASSVVEIAGTPIASVMFDRSANQAPTVLASVAIHEAFHVYQQACHPTWQGNEVVRYLFPVDDANLLSLRRMETEALRRALTANGSQEKRCWTLRALRARQERYAEMASEFSTYERGTELLEGLASYVEAMSVGRTRVDLPREGYAANEVRGRCYKIGHALAVLLDAFAPMWKTAFEADDAQALDLYLLEVLEKSGDQCGEFTEAEIAHFEAVARVDVQDLLAQRSEQRRAFDSQVGMRLSVIAPDTEPLWVSGTDPSNLMIVEGGVLHTRFVHIHHERGQLEMLTDRMDDVVALTVAVGPHPLMNGVLRLTIAGLDTLDVVSDGGSVNISGSGLTGQFTNATVDENDGQVTVYLDKQGRAS